MLDFFVFFTGLVLVYGIDVDNKWESWWNYKSKELGGPEHWGRNVTMPGLWPQWRLCQIGRYQSPLSIEPESLIYDHTLPPLRIRENRSEELELSVTNTGKDVQFTVLRGASFVRDGPLSYEYRVHKLLLKFGRRSSRGSEHRIRNYSYPGEIQVYGFNSDLYQNYQKAMTQPHGIVAIAAFFKLDKKSNTDFSALVAASENVEYKDQIFDLRGMKIDMLLPATREFITYEGSLPNPPCLETVTWIVLNEPLSVTETQLKSLRKLRASKNTWSGVVADNFRPIQLRHGRTLRTNIRLNHAINANEKICEIERDFFYSTSTP